MTQLIYVATLNYIYQPVDGAKKEPTTNFYDFQYITLFIAYNTPLFYVTKLNITIRNSLFR